MKRFLSVFCAHVLAVAISGLIFAPFSFAGAMQIGNLLSQVRSASGSLAGGHVHFYSAGTTTNKTIWTTSAKSVAAANPYTLDANGAAYLFGDGTYRIVIHTAAGATAYDWDNLRIEDFLSGFTGDGTGNISGFDNITATTRVRAPNIGAAAGTDNGVFNNTTTATLNVTGTPTFVDNTLNGADLIDNTIPPEKLQHTGAHDNTAVYWGDGRYATPPGYTLNVMYDVPFTPTDNATYYFGNLPNAGASGAGTPEREVEGTQKIYVPRTGTIKAAFITAHITPYNSIWGTSEAWPLYIRTDNTTDTLIASVADNTAIRTWSNTSMSIPVTAGGYFEIKTICPEWATNPYDITLGGYVYIE